MNIRLKKVKFIELLLSTLIIYTILFPSDILNIKEILLLITLFFGYYGKKIKLSKKLLFYGVLFPSLTIIYAMLRGVDLGSALSFGYVWLFLLLIPIIKNINFDVKKPFIIATYIIALCIDIIFLFDFLNIVSIHNNLISVFFMNMNEIQGLGKGVLGTFGYSIFFKSCPLILVTYGYFIYHKKIAYALPLLLSLFMSGTRANYISCLAITFLILLMCYKDKKNIKKFFLQLLVFTAIIFYAPIAYNKIINLSSLKYSASESIKIADTRIVTKIIKHNSINAIFGTGVGSSFLSSRGIYLSTYEFSFIDYLRQVGIVGFAIFSFFIFFIAKSLLDRKEIWLLFTLILYLAVAFTNPLLVTSTSFMLYIFAICYKEQTE